MRQDVFARKFRFAVNWTWLSFKLSTAIFFLCGCQLPRSVDLANGPRVRQASFASPATDEAVSPSKQQSTPRARAASSAGAAEVVPASMTPRPVLSNSATIRGQSGTWDDGTAGGGDSYRSPMVPTQSNNYLPPAVQPSTMVPPAVGYGQGSYGNTNTGGYYAASPQQPPVNYGTTPTGNGYGYGANTSPAPTIGSYGYGAPANSVSPSDSMMGAVPQYGGGSVYDPGGVYGAAPGFGSANSYGATIAPGATQALGSPEATLAPGIYSDSAGGGSSNILFPDYQPNVRIAPLDVYVQEGRTGRVVLGGSVNSDLGVAGQLVIEERNFDIRRFPTSWRDVWDGKAFRGNGENFRAELMPGSRVERYTVNWATPNLLGYLPYSLSVGGFYYTRQFRDWTEQRLGGRLALGYGITKDLSISSELRLEDVKLFDPIVSGVPELDAALGSNDVYTARFRIAHDTRDSPFLATEGALLELIYDQVFGEYDFPRGQINYSRYFDMGSRPDGSGQRTLASTWKVGITGAQTPLFENFFAGGYSTMRGFSFRGASPTDNNVQVGGEFMFLGSLEYVFPLTADEMLRGVAFVDYGTVERDIEITGENFRVAPGLGVRVSVPALGPAPLAFDFAVPVAYADTDDRQIFSFFMGVTR